MSAFTGSGWVRRLAAGAFAMLCVGIASVQPSPAQTRTLASLADVPALMPAPYHPPMSTAVYSTMLYDGHPYYGGVYQGSGGAHYWH